MSTKVALLGVGGIGRRHLEALALSNNPLKVHVVDPSSQSLSTAREVVGSRFRDPSCVSFLSSASEIPTDIDIAIVATTADVRLQACKALLAVTRPRFLILEKVLFQRRHDYVEMSMALDEMGISAWVNCPRRMWPQYVSLRNELSDAKGLTVRMTSNPTVGLGSNAIHMLDLLAFLSKDHEFSVDASGLHVFDGPTKRNSMEFTGTLMAHGRAGAVLCYTTLPRGSNPLHLDIEFPDARLVFEESAGIGHRWDSSHAWKCQTFEATPVFQSRLTNLVVDQLIEKGDCALTTYEESTILHLSMLEALSDRLSALGLLRDETVPIT